MTAPGIVAVLRTFLYSVLFSNDLRAEVPRAIAYHRQHPGERLPEYLRELAKELAHPTVQARETDELLLRFSETEIRDYLAAVVAGLADLAE
jgi:hypothetical protein